jgi:hypothetical protein
MNKKETDKTGEQPADFYDDLAYRALANPDLSEGLANQIARVSKNTAASLRGGARPGAGRKPLPPHERRKPRTLYLTDAEWVRLLEVLANLKRERATGNRQQ